ncbi:MAG: TrmH family RNA methyltransferase [Roseburia sp.]
MITSSANQKIKNISLLMKKARERKEQGLFVVEGKKMFAELPKEWLKEVYVSERFLEQEDAGRLLGGIEYEVVADKVFSAVSDTQTPQGILCLVKLPRYELSELLCGGKTHLLVLEDIQDPGNLGTMVRTGEGAGVTGIILSRNTVDLFHPKTIRSTMGSVYRIPYFVSDSLEESVIGLKEAGVQIYAAHLNGERQYDEADYKTATAFLIGNEGSGLSEELSELADCRIRIPMEGAVESLNAAVSAALLMYEVNRQRRGRT